MYKIAISDLDGTLLGEHHNISKKTAASIANWIDSGREFVIATGRHYIEADYLQKTLEKPSYLITSNGARIHNPQGEVIFEGNLDSDIVANIAAQEFDSAVQVSIFTDQHWYVSFDVAELADLDVGVKFFAVVKPLQSIDPTTAIKMNFETAFHHWKHSGLSVWISNDFDGTNLGTANWQEVSCTLAEDGTHGQYDWVPSGDIHFQDYFSTDNVRVAFKFSGNNTGFIGILYFFANAKSRSS